MVAVSDGVEMQVMLMVEPQEGMSYDELLTYARIAEVSPFAGLFRSDHWLSSAGHPERAATDAWTTLAGLARETSSIRLGTLVSPVTFRQPIAIAKIVATLDEMSGGRVELGLGAGWFEPEHSTFGIPFFSTNERFEILEEQLRIIVGLWCERTFEFTGKHYTLKGAHCEPEPVQKPHPPIIVGGFGKPRTLRLAAQYADEINLDRPSPQDCVAILRLIDNECGSIGRNPEELRRSAAILWPAGGTAEQRDLVARYAETGLARLYIRNVRVVNDQVEHLSAAVVKQFGNEVLRP